MCRRRSRCCGTTGARATAAESLDLNGWNRKWSTGAKNCLPGSALLFQHVRARVHTCACTRAIYSPIRYRNLRSKNAATTRKARNRRAISSFVRVDSSNAVERLPFSSQRENHVVHVGAFFRARPPTSRKLGAMHLRPVMSSASR